MRSSCLGDSHSFEASGAGPGRRRREPGKNSLDKSAANEDIKRPRRTAMGCLALTAFCSFHLSAQIPPATTLTIDMENVVQYQETFADQTKNGSSTGVEPSIGAPLPFSPGYFIADIASINGKRCKGTTVARDFWFGLRPAAAGNQAIADTNRNQAMEIAMEILQEDGAPIGSIFLTGLTAGGPPPGGPRSGVTGVFAIVGGTGAFVGARGQASTIQQSGRFTSTVENPINRRTFPAGIWRMALQLIPSATPEISSNADGPLILHSDDFSRVSASKPARLGEVLTLIASGLGPTQPGVDPGQPFPASPAQIVIAPVDVTVNGQLSEVLYAGGYPGAVDTYQVNFRIPGNLTPGTASVHLSAAWVTGGAQRIPVR